MSHVYKALEEVDRIFRAGDVFFITLHPASNVGKFFITVFDENHKYVCDIKDCSSFDFRIP